MRTTIPVLNRMSKDISVIIKELSLIKKSLSLLGYSNTSDLDPTKIQLIESLQQELRRDLLENLVRATPHLRDKEKGCYQLRKKPGTIVVTKETKADDLDRFLSQESQLERDTLLHKGRLNLTREELQRLKNFERQVNHLNSNGGIPPHTKYPK